MSRLIVLMYHRVIDARDASAPAPSLISASPAMFERHVRHLARRYRVVSMPEVLEAQRGGRALPARAVLITFDDGYRDFAEVAWPILRRHGMTATLFVPSAYPDHPERMLWWDRLARAAAYARPGTPLELPWGVEKLSGRRTDGLLLRTIQRHVKSLPHEEAMVFVGDVVRQIGEPPPPARPLMLGWKELRQLEREGVTLGAHTRTHASLTRVSLARARAEIGASIHDIAEQTGSRPIVFAYPFGDHDAAILELVREQGIELAFATLEGHNHLPTSDPFRVRRTSVDARGSRLLRVRMLPIGDPIDRWRQKRRTARHRALFADASSSSAEPAAQRPPAHPKRGGPARGPIAYVMSRFPKLTETFVLYELAALEEMGVSVEVFPLLRERAAISHPEAKAWVQRAHFQPFFSRRILSSQLYFLRRSPARYLGLLGDVLWRTLGSANFFVGALGIFPKAVHFAREMQTRRVRHLHAHFATHPAVAAYIVHRLTGIPYSFTAHGSDLHVERRMLDAKVAEADFVVTVSDYNKRLIVDECGEAARKKVHVVHCGVDPNVFSDVLERVAQPVLTLICVASFEEVKGHAHLVAACRSLRERGQALRCHLIGEGPLRRNIETLVARAGLEDVFRFHGGLPRPQVARLLALSDVAVLASQQTRQGKREGIPVALMEAMASGLPVVASRLSGIPELVEHGVSGVLAEPADPVSLANAIEYLAKHPEVRREMGRAGRRKVLEEFDLQRNAKQLLALMVREEPPKKVRLSKGARQRHRRRRQRQSSEQTEARP